MLSFTQFVNQLMSLFAQLGYLQIFALVGLEYACFPLPSEIVLPLIGISVAQTNLNFLSVFLISLIAGLFGSSLCYLIGQYGSIQLLKLLSRHSKQAAKAIKTFNTWFNLYGHWAVLIARIIPLTRTYISLFAGVNHMPFGIFMLYSSVGIALWNLILISVGFYIGDNWNLINSLFNTYSHIVITLFTIIILFIIVKKIKVHSD